MVLFASLQSPSNVTVCRNNGSAEIHGKKLPVAVSIAVEVGGSSKVAAAVVRVAEAS